MSKQKTKTNFSTTCVPYGALERVRFFSQQLVTAEDLNDQTEYVLNKLRRHNRFVHGFGIVCGLKVTKVDETTVTIDPGYALSPFGDEVQIDELLTVDLTKVYEHETENCMPDPFYQEGKTLFLAIHPVECLTHPVRVRSDTCGCDEGQCEFSRIRESFECKLLVEQPAAYTQREQIYRDFDPGNQEVYTHPCLPCPEDNWVLLRELYFSQGTLVLKPFYMALLVFSDTRFNFGVLD